MRPSKALFSVNRLLEGSKTIAYKDSGGTWTIGEGHTDNVKPGDTASRDQIDAWVREDFAAADRVLKDCYPRPLTQARIDALTLFINNVGGTAFATSTLLKKMKAGEWGQVPAQLRRWDHVGAKVIAGLKVRREVEVLIWRGHINWITPDLLESLRAIA